MNLADIDLDAIDAAPPSVVKPKAAPKDFSDDDNEKTNAINLKDIDLDAIDAEPPPRPKPSPPPRAAHAPAPAPSRPQPGRPAQAEPPRAKAAPVPDDDEKTNAINLKDIDLDAIDAAPPK
ncbi:MAG: hypothetical protein JNJ59_10390, partial [Deltaproteobacteria bacterium]|nr:hypothetical protein [Deltaproteobacteria bacterium]